MTWKEKLKITVEDNQTKRGRIFDLFIQSLIVLSLIAFSVETLPNLGPGIEKFLKVFDVFTVVVFTIEYLLRVFVATKKARFVFSFFGIIDFMAILPFYLALGIDLRSIRILRMFRLFRLFKVVRYSKAIQHLLRVFASIKEELVLFFILSSFLLFISAAGIYYFENPAQPDVFASIFHSLWWAVATLTTVGYGDIYPITIGGKVFTAFMLFIGLGIIAVPTGLISSALTKIREPEDENNKNKD